MNKFEKYFLGIVDKRTKGEELTSDELAFETFLNSYVVTVIKQLPHDDLRKVRNSKK